MNVGILVAIIVQMVVARASRIAGAIVGYIVTTGILVWGLSVYGEGGQIALFGIDLSQTVFIILCLAWYGFDTMEFLTARKAGSVATQNIIDKREEHLKSHPDDYQAWADLGNARRDADDLEGAQAAYDRALEIDPEGFEAWTGLGVLHRTRGNRERAMECYEKALEINPNYADAYSSLAVLALQAGQDAKGLEHAERAYNLDQRSPVIAANLAVAYHYNGMYGQRDFMTEKARSLGYANPDALQKIYDGTISIRA